MSSPPPEEERICRRSFVRRASSVLAGAAVVALTPALGALRSPSALATNPKETRLGTSLSPAHVPFFKDGDLQQFFVEARQIGSHVTWIIEWVSVPPFAVIRAVREMTARNGLGFHIQLSPIALLGGRKSPAIPARVGGRSFADTAVGLAFIDQVLTLASLEPTYLGLATEINFLAQNPPEFDAYAALAREAYAAIKRKYRSQSITISFQWDLMRHQENFDLLHRFDHALDVYSFTSYPDAFGVPASVPSEYYSEVRKVLPIQRLGFSEIGWSSAPPSDEKRQAAFYASLPAMMRGVRPEFVTLALLHDVKVFNGDLARLNDVGIRTWDDAPKPSWDAVLKMPPLR